MNKMITPPHGEKYGVGHSEEKGLTTGTRRRQSQFELLRIVAMFMVMTRHVNFLANGRPTLALFDTDFDATLTRTVFEFIAVLGVNVFVMISGWFGIKPTLKGFCGFWFQCFYIYVGAFLVTSILGTTTFSASGLVKCLVVTMTDSWFVVCYAGLFIVAPVLNAFIEHATKRQMEVVLIGFFAYSTLYGWSQIRPDFINGFSLISFLGLYLLAGYARRYRRQLSRYGLAVSALCVALNVAAFYWFSMKSPDGIIARNLVFGAYCNPLVIVGALGIVMWFSALRIGYVGWINWLAKSAFAVYLLHINPWVLWDYFVPYFHDLYSRCDSVLCILAFSASMVMVYAFAVVVDQPRQWLWRRLSAKL